MKKKRIILFFYSVVIFIITLFIRFYHLAFLEFNNDQLQAILLGNDARVHHFLITHGMTSGVGFSNPPFFIQLMGVLTYFSNDPYLITAFFTVLNLIALILAFFYFYKFLPTGYAILTSAILAFSPAFIMYSSNIWAQCMLPFFMILFHFCFYQFIKKKIPLYFILLNLIAGVAAQIHMSGFFLFPAIFILGFISKSVIKRKHLISAGILLVFMYLPYLYHLICEGELSRVLAHAGGDNDIPWNIFRSHFWFVSLDYFRTMFRGEFLKVLQHSLGSLGLLLYPLSCILPVLFIFGFYSYIKFLVKERCFFKVNSDTEPLPFQISGFLVSVVTLGYLIFQVRTPLHYLIVLFPCHAVVTGFACWKLWKYKIARVVIALSIIATVVLLVGMLRFLDSQGGHWCQYGPSYEFLNRLKSQIQLIAQDKYCPDLRLNFPKEGKFDEDAIRFILAGSNTCKSDVKKTPINLSITWDKKAMCYVYQLTRGE
jgi:hypothetical protein